MKKKIGWLLIAVLAFSLIASSTFAMEEEKLQLGEKQINKLRQYGMTEDEIANLTKEKLASFMRKISNVPKKVTPSAIQFWVQPWRNDIFPSKGICQ